MLPLVTAVRLTPPDAVAVKVITSALEYIGVAIVTLFVPLTILPVKVPLKVPPPVAMLKVIVVVLDTFATLPYASCDCTVTLNAVPAVPVEGTALYTNCVAVPAV